MDKLLNKLNNIHDKICKLNMVISTNVNDEDVKSLHDLLKESRPNDRIEILFYEFIRHFYENSNKKQFINLVGKSKLSGYILYLDGQTICKYLSLNNLININIDIQSVEITKLINN